MSDISHRQPAHSHDRYDAALRAESRCDTRRAPRRRALSTRPGGRPILPRSGERKLRADLPEKGMEEERLRPHSSCVTNTVEINAATNRSRVRIGQIFKPRELPTLGSASVHIPDARLLVHLQMRRYAGCPICSLHLRSFARRKDELERAGIREVVVFHSSAEELRKVHTDLPFEVVPDPTRRLYRALGVTTSPRALLDPRGLFAAARAAVARASSDPTAGMRDGSFGLPADFLVAPDGTVRALKYGAHADDQWSVDEVLILANGARAQ
jgi:peroxiredoxin